MITAENIIKRVRRALHDDDSGAYRWPDDVLVDYINDAQYDLREKRPEFWLDSSSILIGIVLADPALLTKDLLLEDSLMRGVSAFVIYRALSEDDADTENLNRAAIYRAQYEEIMK